MSVSRHDQVAVARRRGARRTVQLAAALSVLAIAGIGAAQQPSATATAKASAAPTVSARASASAAPPAASASASAAPPATSASAAPSASASAEPPPAAPPTGAPPNMPPGHPPIPNVMPGMPGMTGPMDMVSIDQSLAQGVVEVRLRDAREQPVVGASIVLVVKTSSVSKGEETEKLTGQTDRMGRYRFGGLRGGSGVSYHVETENGDCAAEVPRACASFASQTFGLQQGAGIAVTLHRFRPTNDPSSLRLATSVSIDVLQEDLSVEYQMTVDNGSDDAFVPDGFTVELPPEAKAFVTSDDRDVAWVSDQRDDAGYRLVLNGTFKPGSTELSFRYQLPYDGSAVLALQVPMFPRVRSGTVTVPAGGGIALELAGARAPRYGQMPNGRRTLTASVSRSDKGPALPFLDVRVTGLPTPGIGRWLAVAGALLAGAAGAAAYYLLRRRRDGVRETEDLMAAREALLGELVALEKARKAGDLGPKSYDRLHTALVDALGRILAQLDVLKPVAQAAGARSGSTGARSRSARS